MRLRISGTRRAVAEVDDGSGWKLVPSPWSFDADRSGPRLDQYLDWLKHAGISHAFGPEPEVPEPVYTLTCVALGYEKVRVDSVEYQPRELMEPEQ